MHLDSMSRLIAISLRESNHVRISRAAQQVAFGDKYAAKLALSEVHSIGASKFALIEATETTGNFVSELPAWLTIKRTQPTTGGSVVTALHMECKSEVADLLAGKKKNSSV